MKSISVKHTSVQAYLLAAMMAAAMLVGCSADEGNSGAGGVAGPSPRITLTATPSTVPAGGTTTLTYSTTDAVSCVASGAWSGNKPPNGSEQVVVPTTPGSYTYTLTCTSSTGQQSAQSTTVTVTGTGTGTGTPPGGITGGGPGSVLPNDGTTPTTVTDGGVLIPGKFVCTAGALAYGPNPTTAVVINGLVGSDINDLVTLLGASTVAQLLSSVSGKELVVDGNLDTAATYNLTAGLLGAQINSIDLLVGLNSLVPVGKYAVFGLTFPISVAELSLIQRVTITTFSGTTKLETANIDATSLNLLGQSATGPVKLYAGLKVTMPYDNVTISLTPTAVTVNLGNAMNVYELCTDGNFVLP